MGIDTLKNITQSIVDFWSNLGKSNKIKLVLVIILIAAVLGVAIYFLVRKDWVPLVTITSAEEAPAVMQYLDENAINYDVRGNTIYVENKDRDMAYLNLRSSGFDSKSMNYDLVTNTTWGQTESDKQRNWIITLQDRIASGIMSFESVDYAEVTLAIPEKNSFIIARDREQPSASVVIRRNAELSDANIKAIESYILTCVEGLEAKNITIVDQFMNRLNRGDQAGNQSDLINSQLETESRISSEISDKARNFLYNLYGFGNATAESTVRVDLRQTVTTSESFLPSLDDEGLIRSSEVTTEAGTGLATNVDVGLDANAVAEQYPAGTETGDYEYGKSVYNYELDRVIEETVAGPLVITELSLAVVVDSLMLEQYSDVNGLNADPATVSQALSNAVGIPAENITVEFLPLMNNRILQDAADAVRQAEEEAARWQLIMNSIIYGLIALALIMIIVLAYRALTARERLEAEALAIAQADITSADMMGSGFDAFVTASDDHNPLEDDGVDTVKQNIEDFIRKDPESAASLLKVWLYEE